MYHLTQNKPGISSIELGRRLGVTQTTAWKIKHKPGWAAVRSPSMPYRLLKLADLYA